MPEHTCSRVNRKLEAFVDGELPQQDQAEVHAHVAVCDHCRSAAEVLTAWKKRTRETVRRQFSPAGLETRIRAGIGEGRKEWWRNPAFQAGLACAAMLALTAGVWMTVLRPMHAQIAAVLGIGAGDHVHCTLERKQPPIGQLNRPLPGHHDEIVPIAQRSLPAGFELLESHFCRYQGRVFTHIVFGRGENRLSVIVTRKQGGEVLPQSQLLSRMKASGIPVYAGQVTGLETLVVETPQSWGFVVSDLGEKTGQQVMAALASTIVQADRP